MMMPQETDAESIRVKAEYDQILAEYQAAVTQIDEEARARDEENARLAAEVDREVADRLAAREAAKAEPQAEKDAKPENPWAQPRQRPDVGFRIGSLTDDPSVTLPHDVPAPAPEPVPAPPARPAPPPLPPPEPVTARHAKRDEDVDDDGFDSNSWLRG